MDPNREILTFQFGNYSNYVGAHWWNLQEFGFNYDPLSPPSDINHDVLYREGSDPKGRETFAPRLLLVDLDGSLKHLSEGGGLYDNNEKDNTSTVEIDLENVEKIAADACPKHEFQTDLDEDINIDEKNYNFSETVDAWTDYLYTRFHPRTVNIVKEYKHDSKNDYFSTFEQGMQLWNSEQFSEDFTDKIRQYMEECDACQGFQILFDCNNGFSGLATQCLEHLSDEYLRTTFAIPVFNPISSPGGLHTDNGRVINTVLAYSELIDKSSIFLPLSTRSSIGRRLGDTRNIPLLNYKEDNLYETSSVLASFLDTISIKYRLRGGTNANNLWSLCNDLTTYGRKLTAASLSMPFRMRSDIDLIECLDQYTGDITTQLSPDCQIGTVHVVESFCVRGIPKSRLKRPYNEAREQMKMAAYRCTSVSEMFQLYLYCQKYRSVSHVAAIEQPMLIKNPFPSFMFDSVVNCQGFEGTGNRPADKVVVSVPVVAGIHCSKDISDTLQVLHEEASFIQRKQPRYFSSTATSKEDCNTALESILDFKEKYEDNYAL